jgi:hypothetical protein
MGSLSETISEFIFSRCGRKTDIARDMITNRLRHQRPSTSLIATPRHHVPIQHSAPIGIPDDSSKGSQISFRPRRKISNRLEPFALRCPLGIWINHRERLPLRNLAVVGRFKTHRSGCIHPGHQENNRLRGSFANQAKQQRPTRHVIRKEWPNFLSNDQIGTRLLHLLRRPERRARSTLVAGIPDAANCVVDTFRLALDCCQQIKPKKFLRWTARFDTSSYQPRKVALS